MINLKQVMLPPLRQARSPSKQTIGAVGKQIDIDTVIRASQALSSEILLDRLIETLMTLVLGYAGADSGALILYRNDSMQVKAVAHTSLNAVQVVLLGETTHQLNAPEAILRLVAKTRETLILSDSRISFLISGDPYFKIRRPKSLLCLPLLKQAKLVGLIYLENSHVANTFSPRRKAVLELIASQAAVSLENARLFEEVTEENRVRKTVEVALRENEAALAAAQRISRTGSWLLDVYRNTVTGSAEHFRIFGFDPNASKLPMEAYMDRVHPEDRLAIRQKLQTAISTQTTFTSAYRIILPDGAIRFLDVIGSPKMSDEGTLVYFGTIADITERRNVEEALRLAQSELARVSRLTTMGELAGSIIHEINQPLAAMVTNAEASIRLLALDVPDLEETRAAIADLARDGRRISEVVMSLRSLARKSGLKMARVDIDDVIVEVLAFIQRDLERERINVQTDLSMGGEFIFGDRVQLQQVLSNLIRNAIEAMGAINDRRRDLVISSRSLQCRQAMIVVEDCGVGIEKATAERIFDPLFTTRSNGMGLGLSICRSIVEAHGGRISAAPRTPHGSIFSFTLNADHPFP
jgi:PAS domain S-box-containing protein